MPPAKFVTPAMEAHFSADDRCTPLLVREVSAARAHIRLTVMGPVPEELCAALESAVARGVDVRVISSGMAGSVSHLVMVLDRASVVVSGLGPVLGDLLVVRNGALAAVYLKTWEHFDAE